jgi:hypothetical protein
LKEGLDSKYIALICFIKPLQWSNCLIVGLVFIASCSTPPLLTTSKEITLPPQTIETWQEAVRRAEEFAKRMEVNLDEKTGPTVERRNSSKPSISERIGESDYAKSIEAKLTGRSYWEVHYSPKQLQLGGDEIFFIEASTGALLTQYRGR